MTMRQIRQRPGSSKLGTMANRSSSTRREDIVEITVYEEHEGARGIGVQFRAVASGKVVSLSTNAAVELAKGILQNLPDVYLAADYELQAILKEKVAAAERDAMAVVEAVRRPLTPMPSATPKESNPEVTDRTKIDTTDEVAYPVDLTAVPTSQVKKRRKS